MSAYLASSPTRSRKKASGILVQIHRCTQKADNMVSYKAGDINRRDNDMYHPNMSTSHSLFDIS